ncbi:helix-turn-helix domain-containing protein [Streptomyces sp. NPDC055897]
MARAENKVTAGPTAQMVAKVARKLRARKGWTQEHLGKRIGFSAAAVSAMETLAQPASDDMLVALERVLGDGLEIFEDARVPMRMEKYPAQFQDYVALERQALVLRPYVTFIVHGLFQTEEYARALIGGGYPPWPEQRVEELVEARMARKALFDRSPAALIELVLEESVLKRVIGGPEVMRGQMLHLAECSRRRNVTLQVLPMDCGLSGEHAGDRGTMNVMETLDHDRLGFLEVQGEGLLITDPSKVSALGRSYAKIQSQALDPRTSLGLIEQLAGEWK